MYMSISLISHLAVCFRWESSNERTTDAYGAELPSAWPAAPVFGATNRQSLEQHCNFVVRILFQKETQLH